jgi:N-acetylglucosamine-6-sulfatase
MRKPMLLLTSVVSAVVLCLTLVLFTGTYREDGMPEVAAQTAAKPNIVLILTDDMTLQDAEYMPKLHSLMMDQGTTFENAFVTNSLCCPSRATILRGQYTHNHQLWTNDPPLGGFQGFHDLGHESSTVATLLRSGGYRTALIGKYLNGYPAADPTYVPPGWDEWYAESGGGGYYGYKLNENGQVVQYGSSAEDYKTDVLARKATDYVRRSAANEQPFFMYLGHKAPHGSTVMPASRHEDSYPGVTAPRPPSFNEADVSDKPKWVSSRPPLSADDIAYIDELYGERLRSLLAVDDMIESLVDTLRDSGELDNTYIFFTSDNGYHLGQHRLTPGKWTAYEEDIRVPVVVRGPGVPAGQVSDRFTLNNDFAPTFADLADVNPPSFVDGRSLAPLLGNDPPTSVEWRSAFLVEIGRPNFPFEAVRTERHLYVEHDTGERELYDLIDDPYQLDNRYATADPDLIAQLQARLEALRGCVGAECRSAESTDSPTPPPSDTTPPETSIAIDSGPSGTVKQNNATFTFSSDETGTTFECSLDGVAFSACSSPKKYTGLAKGSHTFEVRATDAAGNTDASPASRTWTVGR